MIYANKTNILKEANKMKVIYDDKINEEYKDWCFDCDHCNGNLCMHDSDCVNGSMWTPSSFEYDLN